MHHHRYHHRHRHRRRSRRRRRHQVVIYLASKLISMSLKLQRKYFFALLQTQGPEVCPSRSNEETFDEESGTTSVEGDSRYMHTMKPGLGYPIKNTR